MRILIFTLITLMCSVCYGQVPLTKDKLLILVVGNNDCQLSTEADRHFASAGVRKHMNDKGIQFIRIYGDDTPGEWRGKYKITHYPSIVYFMKDKEGNYQLSKTVSGMQSSKALGSISQVQHLLGMKAETYLAPPRQSVPSNHPMIPGSQAQPPVQYVAPPQRYVQPPQQFIGGS